MSRKMKHGYVYEYVYKYNDTAKYAFVHGYANTCNHDDMCISYFVFFKKNLHYEGGTCVEMLNPDLMYKSNTSGVRGVYYSKKRNKWIAQIMFKQKCYYLGGYDKKDEAAEARAEAEEKIFGNFIQWYCESHPHYSLRHS